MNLRRIFAITVITTAATAYPALAQDIFAAPANFLTQMKNFVTGPNGVLLGGAAIALAAISAAAPRIPVSWGNFFVILVVLCIFFGAFNIAASIQGVAS